MHAQYNWWCPNKQANSYITSRQYRQEVYVNCYIEPQNTKFQMVRYKSNGLTLCDICIMRAHHEGSPGELMLPQENLGFLDVFLVYSEG